MAAGQTEGKRNANMDFLRIISMIMVTMLHALTKSDLLFFLGGASSVIIFMLISGYFLISSKIEIGRLVEMILQTMFYSAGSFAFFLILGKFSQESQFTWRHIGLD